MTTPTKAQITRELNNTVHYTMWSVFTLLEPLGHKTPECIAETQELFSTLKAQDVTIRGTYDVAGLRADADVMIWWHAPEIEALQSAYRQFRASVTGQHFSSVWSAAALHRPAEFNKGHIPAFMRGEEPREYLCVYPFVRSYEWYLLPDEERRQMLAEHGKMAREYQDVRANTVASFALGDYEWILAFEGDELHRIVDVMRHLRSSAARRHVREEVPFYTGRRRSVEELLSGL